jgi:hypothetical protein
MVSVLVEVDESSAQQTQRQPSEQAYGDVFCEDTLTVEANVTIELLGSPLTNRKKISLLSYSSESPSDFSMSIDKNEIINWAEGTDAVSLSVGDDVGLSMEVEAMRIQDGCAGEIRLTVSQSHGDGTASAANGPFGSWSDTGCPVGEHLVDLSAANSDSGSLLEQIEKIWSETAYLGKWDDGEETTLDLSVTVLSEEACMADPVITIPAQVEYGTRDGRLGKTTVNEVTFTASADEHGVIWVSSLHINDARVCADTSDSLAYTLNSCAELESIHIQLGISRKPNGTASFSDEGVMIYEYDRNSTAAPGAADRVRNLELLSK